MSASATLISLDEYLHTSYRPDCDFVEGRLESREQLMGEFEHSRLQLLLGSWFVPRERDWGIVTVVEQRIRVAPDCVRVCDVTLLRADVPREKVILTPPLLCIEILSPEDRLYRAERVLADYRSMGVEQSWLINPLRRIAYTFDRKRIASGRHGSP